MTRTTACMLAAILSFGAVTLVSGQSPAYSTEEKLAIENVNLRDELRKAQLEADKCRAELAGPRNESAQQDLARRVQALRTLIETNHPGWTWDPASGAFTKRP